MRLNITPATPALRTRTSRADRWALALIAALTLAAFALRSFNLTARSLWLDESFTLLRINDTWAHMLANIVIRPGIATVDINPPLYFALLKVWAALSGASEFALKAFSAWAAVLIVPLTFVVARRMAGRSAGLMAAVLAAVLAFDSGAYQWYAGELRMYAWVACLGALTLYALHRALTERRAAWVGVWLVALGLGLMTHYSFIGLSLGQLLVGVAGLALGMRSRPQRRTVLMALLVIVAVVVVAVVAGGPTINRVVQIARTALQTPQGKGVPFFDFANETLNALLFGLNAADPTGGVIIVIAALLALVGVVLPWRRVNMPARALLAASIVVPFAFWLALAFFIENQPSARYLVYSFPAWHALMALGAAQLWRSRTRVAGRVAAVGAAILVLGSSTHGLLMALTPTPTFQDDWRAFGASLRRNWQPGDGIIINFSTPEGALPYVIGDLAPNVTYARDWLPMPQAEAQSKLRAFNRVWYANTGGDGGIENRDMQALFAPFLLKRRSEFAGRTTTIEWLQYETQPDVRAELPDSATPVTDVPQDRVAIAGYAVRAGSNHNPNANFIVDVYWRHGDDDTSKHGLTVRLKSGEQTWLDWSLDANLRRVPDAWHLGTLYRQSYIVPVPPGLPMQPYTLEMQAHAGEKGEVYQQVQQTLSTEAFECCVRVADWPGERWHARDVTLALAEYENVVKPGQPMPIALTWRATQANTAGWQTELRLETLLGGEIATTRQDAGVAAFPPGVWPVGELARDLAAVTVPFSASPGWVRLSLNRYRDGRLVDGTLLGLVRVEDYPRTPVTNDVQHRVNAKIGDLTLLGYSALAPFERGQTVGVLTHWRVDSQPQRDGKLFLHVIAPNGELVSQDDNAPFDNTRSTLSFRAGDGIDQLHRLALKPDLPPGEYTLFVGIYDSSGDHARWPAQQDGQPAPNDLVKVGTFTLK